MMNIKWLAVFTVSSFCFCGVCLSAELFSYGPRDELKIKKIHDVLGVDDSFDPTAGMPSASTLENSYIRHAAAYYLEEVMGIYPFDESCKANRIFQALVKSEYNECKSYSYLKVGIKQKLSGIMRIAEQPTEPDELTKMVVESAHKAKKGLRKGGFFLKIEREKAMANKRKMGPPQILEKKISQK